MPPDTALAEQRRPPAVQPYRDRDHQQEWRQQHQSQRGAERVDETLEGARPRAERRLVQREHRDSGHIAHVHHAQADLEQVWHDPRLDVAAGAQIHDVQDLAPLVPGQGHDDLVDSLLCQNLRQAVGVAQRAEATDVRLATHRIVVHKTNHFKPQLRLSDQVAHHRQPHVLGAHDQHPVQTGAMAAQLAQHASSHHPCQDDEQHDQSGRVDENQSRVDQRSPEEEDEDLDHEARSHAVDHAVDLVGQTGAAPGAKHTLQAERDQRQRCLQDGHGHIGQECREISRIDIAEPLQLIADHVSDAERSEDQHDVRQDRDDRNDLQEPGAAHALPPVWAPANAAR